MKTSLPSKDQNRLWISEESGLFEKGFVHQNVLSLWKQTINNREEQSVFIFMSKSAISAVMKLLT